MGLEQEGVIQERRDLAMDYGNWWHRVMERLPWSESVDSWGPIFEKEMLTCPSSDRAKEEWKRFKLSEVIKKITGADLIIHTELPILVTQEEGNCLEGFIDLAALDMENDQWLIIDWKTDQIEKENQPQNN